jgi:hypothetical protein
MAKPRRGSQQQSKKKLQVKQRKQTKAGTGTDKYAEPSNLPGTAAAENQARQASISAARAQEGIADAQITFYGLCNLGETCFYNSALQVNAQACVHDTLHTATTTTFSQNSLRKDAACVDT